MINIIKVIVILYSSDYGASWTVYYSIIFENIFSGYPINNVFINGDNAIAGEPALYYSSDIKKCYN